MSIVVLSNIIENILEKKTINIEIALCIVRSASSIVKTIKKVQFKVQTPKCHYVVTIQTIFSNNFIYKT